MADSFKGASVDQQLFKRYASEPFTGKVERSEDGKPFYRYQAPCSRCGGAGQSEKWRRTGLTCYDCGGNGRGPICAEPLYTAEQLARLNAAADKRAAKKAAKAAAAEAERRAPFLAWSEANAHVLAQVRAHGPANLVERLDVDAARSVISPGWILDVAIVSALREFAKADAKAASVHVGRVGDRQDLQLTCEKLLDYSERSRGYLVRAFYIALMRDSEGNRIVYRGGNPPLGEGQQGRFRVTIKEHGERDGELQTVIQRAKSINQPEENTNGMQTADV
jgi:hypothetical protein